MSVRESKADFAGTGHQYAKAKSKVDQSTTCCEKAHAEAAAYPDAADTAPSDSVLTAYDEEHAITYMRMLDADAEGADWREVARIVLHVDPEREPDRARRAFESHLARAIPAIASARVTGGASKFLTRSAPAAMPPRWRSQWERQGTCSTRP